MSSFRFAARLCGALSLLLLGVGAEATTPLDGVIDQSLAVIDEIQPVRPVPEPSGALVLAVGLLIARRALRRAR